MPALAFPALAWAPFSMIEQNGQAITIVSAPVACSCSKRAWLIRLPGSCSSNSSPPPAPQQNGLSSLRTGSATVGADAREQRPRLVDRAGVATEIARVVIRHGSASARRRSACTSRVSSSTNTAECTTSASNPNSR